jgi:heat-inducible transcriptional repressor
MAELSARARQILYACITEFVATGEPVGSRTLSKKHGLDLSAASIRNVLSDLEEWGYLRQPHTSAGRVPTDRAFRLFIDALMRTRELAPEDIQEIRARLEMITPGSNLMRESGRLLSELTGTAAVVVTPRAESLTLKHLRFVRLSQGELLAILVLSDGTVQNRFIRGETAIGEAELQRVHNLLDDVTDGRTLGDLRELFSRRLASEMVQKDDLRRRAFALGEAAVGETLEQEALADVVIEGQAKLLEQPEFAGAEGMKQVVSALDERASLVRLLDATLEAKGTTVVVGHEAGDLGGGQLSLVGAAYKDNGRAAGSIGVIGPTRMDYPKVLPLVAATANAMSALISRRDRRGGDDRDGDE